MSPNDDDPNNDHLSYSTTPVSGPSNGSVTINNDGTFIYTPNPGFSGPDQYVYSVCDIDNACDSATVYITVLPSREPLAIDDINNTLPGTPVDGNVSTNDSDPDGDPLTVNTTPVDAPDNGAVILNPDGSYTYTPDPGFTGQDQFEYQTCDANGLCDTAVVTIDVIGNTPANDAPVANNDHTQTLQDTPVDGNASSNDIDPDGDPLTVNTTPVSGPSNGTVTLSANGDFTYTPDPGFLGTDAFDYQVCDNSGACDTATVTIDVLPDDNGPDNDPPFAVHDVVTGDEGDPITGDLSPNDDDPNGDPLVYDPNPSSGPDNGTVTINPDGTFTYTPDPGYVGPDEFVYVVCDTAGLCDSATVHVTVQPGRPLAIDDFNNTLPGTPVDGNVSTNDSDPNDDPLTVNTTPLSGPSNGTVALNPDGSYTYTPDPGFTGDDQFTYQTCDTNGLCDTATVTIDVISSGPGNDEPVANNDATQTLQDEPVDGNVSSNDIDPDGDPLTVNTTPVSGPSNGTVTLNPNGDFTYTPDPGFLGTDQFDYQVCDNSGACDTATVTIDVQPDNNGPDNDPPFAVDDAVNGPEDDPITGDLSPNDSDPNGDPLTYDPNPSSGPDNGTVTINPDGTFTYTPDPGYVGPDEFVYVVCDNGGLCDSAAVHITLQPGRPLAIDDINNTLPSTPVDGNVTTNDSDPNDDPLTVNTTPLSGPSNGTVALNADGSYTYTPDAGFSGEDQFVYQTCNSSGLCDTATVSIGVISTTPANDGPVANDDATQTFQDEPIAGNVSSNDLDPDGDPLIVDSTPVSGPSNGTLTLNANGSFIYTPDPGFLGTDTFDYRVCDSNGECDIATVTIDVLPDENGPANDPPFAVDDAVNGDEDDPITGDLSPNDNDPNGDPLVYDPNPSSGPDNGTVTINPDGTFTYTPDPGYVGPDEFVYVVCDTTAGLCDSATVHVTVLPGTPLAVDDVNTTLPDTPVSGNVSTNDSDPNGDPLTVNTTPVSGPSNGTVTLNPDGSYTYTPDPGFTGTDDFVYQTCDAGGLCDSATVTINVIDPTPGTNNPPIAVNDPVQTFVDDPITGNVAANDFDPDGDPITVNTTPVSGPSNGSLTLNPDGSFTYTPDPGFIGTDVFDYQICDNNGACDTAQVIIDVIIDNSGSDNDPPFAVDDTENGSEGSPVTGDLSTNDYDPNGDPLVYDPNPSRGPDNGTVVINPDGTFTYTPDPGYTGPDEFVYVVCDTAGLCDSATVHIIVLPSGDPLAIDDINTTFVDSTVTGNVLTNDSDPDGDPLTVNTTPVDGPDNGTVTLNPDGTYTYTPDPGFTGDDSFQYQVCDGSGLCDTATVTIAVIDPLPPGNNPPVANNDPVETIQDEPFSGNLTSNDFDPDGDPITLNTTPVDGPDNGTVTINPDGSFTYTPDPGFVGKDDFQYQICDSNGACDTATVVITVAPDDNGPSNDAPFAVDDAVAGVAGTTLTGDLSTNDFEPDGDSLIYQTTPSSGPSNGTVTINPDGTFTYTPDPGTSGPDQFVYVVCDINGACDSATAYILVIPDTASIGGFVWNDENQDGIQDAGEDGIANSQVNLLDGNGIVIATTTTDSAGFYSFEGLEQNRIYGVEFSTPSGFQFSPQGQGSDPSKDSDANPTSGITQAIILSQGETNLNIGAGMFDIFDLAIRIVYDRALSPNQRPTSGVANPGDDLIYIVSVFNQGTQVAENIEISTYLPPMTTLNDSLWTDEGNGTASRIIPGPLNPGDSIDVTITITLSPFYADSVVVTEAEISAAEDAFGMDREDADGIFDNDPLNDGVQIDNAILDPTEEDNFDFDGPQLINQGCVSACDMDDWDAGQYGFLFTSGAYPGANPRYNYVGGSGRIERFLNGSAHLTGTVANVSDPNLRWEIDVWLIRGRNWGDWSSLGRSYKIGNGVQPTLYQTWDFFELDASRSRLYGQGTLAGDTLSLTHMPATLQYGFQYGQGANSIDSDFGLSGWFTYTSTSGNFNGTGDFIADLNNCGSTCSTPPLGMAISSLLQGAFDPATNQMRNALNLQGVVPLSQPFNAAPWNYAGTESVAVMPHDSIVDWVLVEARDVNDPRIVLDRQAALILQNGEVVATDGHSLLTPPSDSGFYISLTHRNHLSAMTATPVSLVNNRYFADLTAVGSLYVNPVEPGTPAALVGGRMVLFQGDESSDDQVNSLDLGGVMNNYFTAGMNTADVNLDGVTNSIDVVRAMQNYFRRSHTPK
jgi:hypothetical protein